MNRMTLCFVAAAIVAGVALHVDASPTPQSARRRPAVPARTAPTTSTPSASATRATTSRPIQAALRDAGYPVDVDGYFGPHTHSAVRAFQDDNDLHVDGLVGRRRGGR